jgi:hypothetical protein
MNSIHYNNVKDVWIANNFTPGKEPLGPHWIGGWVEPRAGLDDVEKRKFLTLTGIKI